MKAVSKSMQVMICGGKSVSKVCKGKDNGTGIPHSVTISGSGPTDVEAKADFNRKLRAHKRSQTYFNSTHSASFY